MYFKCMLISTVDVKSDDCYLISALPWAGEEKRMERSRHKMRKRKRTKNKNVISKRGNFCLFQNNHDSSRTLTEEEQVNRDSRMEK